MNNLAQTLKAQGDLASARELFEQVLEVRRRVLGEGHPDTLTSMNNLAETLHDLGDLAGARQLYEELIAIREDLAGPGDEVPLKPRSVHAWAAPTSRLEAGVPSASEDVSTRYALPTSRLQAGATNAFRGRGRPVAPVRR